MANSKNEMAEQALMLVTLDLDRFGLDLEPLHQTPSDNGIAGQLLMLAYSISTGPAMTNRTQ